MTTTQATGTKRGVGRPRKPYKNLTIKMDETLHERATMYAKANGKKRTAVIEEAVRYYLNRAELEKKLRKKIADELVAKIYAKQKEDLLQGII
jgi:metal-responsive CopG/Arc/MetJ family transcriptional regulator